AKYGLDEDEGTFWHSDWSDSSDTLPQELLFTFESPEEIEKITYLPRQGSSNNGSAKKVSIFVTGENSEEVEVVTDHDFDKSKDLKAITFDPITAKQVRFVITSSYGDTEATHDSFASAAEVAFYPPEEGVDPEPEVNREALEAAIKAAEDKDQAE